MHRTSIKTVSAFLDAVGRDRFESELGHSKQVVSRAIADDLMPAHWYFDCRDWCQEIGVEVPEHLFRRSRKRSSATTTQNVNAARANQSPKMINVGDMPHKVNAGGRV